jgi:hypothetical protein
LDFVSFDPADALYLQLSLISIGLNLFSLAVSVVAIIGLWAVFRKAGRPGWAALIPFYNAYVLVKTAGRPGWWAIVLFIPLASIPIAILVAIDLAHAFGRSTTFGVLLLWLASPVGYLMLGFGDARYRGQPQH